jgi:hypothetical protein
MSPKAPRPAASASRAGLNDFRVAAESEASLKQNPSGAQAAALDHAALPSIVNAKLPSTYEGARAALAQCTRIDECQDWADKAEALASYAKQAQDDGLRKMADRIQARAIRRCGELLKQIASGSKQNLVQYREDGAVPSVTRTQAADEAGLSERQRKTAIRVSRVPDAEFEDAVESDEPATVTALAERGTQKLGKEAAIRAMRERAAAEAEARSAGANRSPERFGIADDLEQVLRVLRGDRSRIAQIPLAKRVALARGCLGVLNVTLDDLRPIGDGL